MGRLATEGLNREPFQHGLEIDDEMDPRDAYARVQARIRAYREAGWQVPDDLRRIERHMMTEFMSESQGR